MLKKTGKRKCGIKKSKKKRGGGGYFPSFFEREGEKKNRNRNSEFYKKPGELKGGGGLCSPWHKKRGRLDIVIL